MDDTLEEIIARVQAKRFVPMPTSRDDIELISFGDFDKSDIKAVRNFQAAVSDKLGVDLDIVGGGHGCTKIRFKPKKKSRESLRLINQELLEDPAFREEAMKAKFQIAVLREPDVRVILKSGAFETLSNEQGLLLFCSYAHEDEKYKEDFDKHLTLLQRKGFVRLWHDRRIVAGMSWEDELDDYLEAARMIVLLISADFLSSDYCYGKEMTRALARYDMGEAAVLPIIVKPVDWELAPFAKLQVLPKDGKAVTKWRSQDEAWTQVSKEIRKIIDRIQESASSKKKAAFTAPRDSSRF
jgi:hypothetical protein